MHSAVVLQYSVKPSLRYAVLLLLSHVIVTIAVCVTAMPWPVMLVMALQIFMSLIYYLARDVLLLLPYSWREISLERDRLTIVVRYGFGFLGQVDYKTVVSPYLVVLLVWLEGHRRMVSRVIFPDAMSACSFRELCVRLKFA
jgi:hypothetical protein